MSDLVGQAPHRRGMPPDRSGAAKSIPPAEIRCQPITSLAGIARERHVHEAHAKRRGPVRLMLPGFQN
jgi:hypothetical protein